MSLMNWSQRCVTTVRVIALLSAPGVAIAQGTGVVSGIVADSLGAPIGSARVSVDGATLATGTTQIGRYTIGGIRAGAHVIRARVIGYREQQQSVTVVAGQTVTLDFRLNRAPLELERVVVSTGYGTQTKANVTGVRRSPAR